MPASKDRKRIPTVARAAMGTMRSDLHRFNCDGDHLVATVATDLFESLDSAVSLSCEILLRYGELDQLVRKSVSPSSYNDPIKFRTDYQAVSFLKKTPFKGMDTRKAALEKFLEAELQCSATNKRMRDFCAAPERVSGVVHRVHHLAVRKIADILGSFDTREWLYSCRFGPGVWNSPEHSGLTSIYDKLQVTPTVSYDFREMGAMLVTSSTPWARSILDIDDQGFCPIVRDSDLISIPGNRVTFVPKTAVTDRPIAIEPLLNIYAQLGIGAMVRRRLKRVGIDLDTQLPNQEGALLGSIDGSLATIDLSSASDTVAKEVVRSLLPERWHFVMDLCRSKIGDLDGKCFRYEKFSSMGNGFTFELETLIFLGLSLAACEVSGVDESQVRVYGDDIVVPSSCFDLLEECLTFFGFTLNRAKSFKDGYFRESCGKDYYYGKEVRPFFNKNIPSEVSHLFVLANGLRRLAHRWGNALHCDQRMYPAWRRVVRAIPRSISRNCRVPAHAGDDHGLISNWDEAQLSVFVVPHKGGWDGWHSARLVSVPVKVREANNFNGGVASLLYRCRHGFVDDLPPAPPRQGRECHYELRVGYYSYPWTEVGAWSN